MIAAPGVFPGAVVGPGFSSYLWAQNSATLGCTSRANSV
jgi:hypothetical protein